MSGTVRDLRPAAGDRSARWSLAASASSFLSALLASLCCVGPLLFALTGLGGAGLLFELEPYRLYFIAVTALLLGAGFYFTYRSPRAGDSEPGCACPAPTANRAGEVMLWVVTVLVAAFLSFPYLAPYLFSAPSTLAAEARARLSTATLRVEGMTCASCSVTIQAALEELDGVEDARVEVEARRAVISYDAAKVTPEQLVEAVKQLGYEARLARS